MKRHSGFTLLELLVVMVVIGLLAAIIVPVFGRAKESARRSADMAKMNSLRTALQLYRVDQGAYPPALLGYVTLYQPANTDVIPADLTKGFLYPARVPSVEDFKPALSRAVVSDTTNAVYPNQDPRTVGSAPLHDLTGDGNITAADDPAGARQAFGPADGPVCVGGGVTCVPTDIARYYSISGFDVAEVRDPAGGTRTELRYALFWSTFGLGAGSATDDPRQLGYNNPPEDTVITWNSYFRDYDGNEPKRARRDIMLFLGGNARMVDSRDVFDYSWRIRL